MNRIVVHNALSLPFKSGIADLCVTSPPYFWCRDYGCDAQLGHEPSPTAFIDNLRAVAAEIWRVLKADGVLYLNLGDTYYSGKGQPGGRALNDSRDFSRSIVRAVDIAQPDWGLSRKSLLNIPARVSLSLQDDGWILRSAIIWHRPNAFVDVGVKDRPPRRYEHVFLFAKSRQYYYAPQWLFDDGDVWVIPAASAQGHSAAYPDALAERCILTGCAKNGVVLDPFAGSGTTALVALRLGRRFIGGDLSMRFAEAADRRLMLEAGVVKDVPLDDLPLFAQIAS